MQVTPGYRDATLPSSSSAIHDASYIFRSASVIDRECTDTDRATSSVKMNRFGSDSMLPSKINPTTSAFRLMTGLPELPPMMSFVETKLYGVVRSRLPFLCTHRCGSLNGSLSSNAADRS